MQKKTFDKIQYSFIINTPEIEYKEHTNMIKSICDKPPNSIILNGERLKVFPRISRTRQGCPPANRIPILPIESPSQNN